MAESNEVPRPVIYVLAGTNGAGKSSIGGAMLVEAGMSYFNPDTAADKLQDANSQLSRHEANSLAWEQSRAFLERAIKHRENFAFETTLGGNTITALLESAIQAGIEVRIWYVGLTSPELHIARVRARVAKGGHDIPEATIRRRYNDSRTNLIQLLPGLKELRVFDNSEDADPSTGKEPLPKLILHWADGSIVERANPNDIPDWAKPIVMSAIQEHRTS